MANKIFFVIIVVIGYLSFFTSCANIGMPSGGVKDTIPPYVVKSYPSADQINFNESKVRIAFNEFVIVEGMNEKFVVSPPLSKRPIFRTKGKMVIVDLNDKLKPNTTYSLDFKDGIKDNNERNPLKNLRLAFSTGSQFDSLRIVGYVKDAFNLEPIANNLVLAYRGKNDSAVYKRKPDFIAKTDAKGFFALTNLPADTFQIYGLSDVDNNMKYTPGVDSVSFLQDRIIPTAQFIPEQDTTVTGADTLVVFGKTRFSPGPQYLLRFGESYFDQRLEKYDHPTRKTINLTFNQSVADTFSVEPINFSKTKNWKFLEMSQKKDSVKLWLTDSTIYSRDTLIMRISYLQQDTLKKFFIKNDTLRFYFTDVTKEAKNKRKERRRIDREESSVAISSNGKPGFDVYRNLVVECPEPIAKFDSSMIHLLEKVDTLYKPIKFKLTADSLTKRRFNIHHKWKYGTSYRLEMDSGAVKTIYNIYSKKYKEDFKTQEEEYYGKIIVDLQNVTGPTLLQLVSDDKDEKVLKKISVRKSGPITFDFLEPRKYLMKAIFDRNDNGVWDPGNLIKRIQPEEVVYYQTVIKVRSNWDNKPTFTLPSQELYDKKIVDEELEAQKLKDKLKKKKKTSAF